MNRVVVVKKINLSQRWRKASRITRWVLGVVVVLLVLFRLALPFLIKSYVNRQLDKAPDYDGYVRTIDVHLWRGAYQIQDVAIFKTSGGVTAPLFAAKTVDLSIQWKELFHGAVAGEVVFDQPRINFVHGPTPEQSQSGTNANWDKTLESLFPFQLNRVEIKEGQVHFQNEHSTPPVDIFVDALFAVATNLNNTRDLRMELPAGLVAHGKTLGGGEVNVEIHLNPLAPTPTFEVDAQLTNVTLVALNDFLQAYGKFDVKRGTFGLYTSVAAKEGSYEGYFKVLFENLDIFDWEKDRKKNPLKGIWQAIVATLTTAFKNQPKDRLALKVPVSGSFTNTDVHVWTAVGTLLRNAFIQALVPRLDEKVKVEDVKKPSKTP
jgi:hypothetical protein